MDSVGIDIFSCLAKRLLLVEVLMGMVTLKNMNQTT